MDLVPVALLDRTVAAVLLFEYPVAVDALRGQLGAAQLLIDVAEDQRVAQAPRLHDALTEIETGPLDVHDVNSAHRSTFSSADS